MSKHRGPTTRALWRKTRPLQLLAVVCAVLLGGPAPARAQPRRVGEEPGGYGEGGYSRVEADPASEPSEAPAAGDEDSAVDGAEAAGAGAPRDSSSAGSGDQPYGATGYSRVEPDPKAAAAATGTDPSGDATRAPGAGDQPTPSPAEAPATPPSAPKRPGADNFVEGELLNVGAAGLVPWQNRVGLVLGVERLGEVFYGLIMPQVSYQRDILEQPFGMTFAVPLRLQLLDARPNQRWDGAGTLRTEDWNSVADYAQVIRRISWGGKEKHFYLDMNQFLASSLGHGTLMKRYNPNLDLNRRRVSLQLDAFSDYGGVESYLNDITAPNVLGALVFAKPLSLIDRSSSTLRSFSVGFSVVADIDAPVRSVLDLNDVDDDGRRHTELEVDQDTFAPVYEDGLAMAYGVDVEVKLVDKRALDWKTYADYSWLQGSLPDDSDAPGSYSELPTRSVRSGGFAWGHLLRMNLGADPVHALRVRAEYRLYAPNYLPSYFDALYEVQRVECFGDAGHASTDLTNRTKLQRVLGRDPAGPPVHGAYFETSWRLGHYLGLGVGLELNNRTDDNNMFVHLEVPHLGRWQLAASYYRRMASDFGDLFTWFDGEADLFFLKTRYGLGDVVHISLEALTPFGVGPESFFRSTVQLNLALELGFSY